MIKDAMGNGKKNDAVSGKTGIIKRKDDLLIAAYKSFSIYFFLRFPMNKIFE